MENKPPDREQLLFLNLVQSLVGSAWIALGKLQNPVTKQTSLNLPEAEMSIDLLAMLQTKTRGNLTPEEQHFLEKALSDLRMNYFEIKIKTPSQPDSTAAPQQQA